MSTVFLTVGQYFNLAAITMITSDSLSSDTLFYQSKIQLHRVIYQTHHLQSNRISSDRTKINLLETSSWERTNGISLSLQKLIQTVLHHRNYVDLKSQLPRWERRKKLVVNVQVNQISALSSSDIRLFCLKRICNLRKSEQKVVFKNQTKKISFSFSQYECYRYAHMD